MSKFLTRSLEKLVPYVPGEQPQDKQYIKLNTNENPYPPSPNACEIIENQNIEDLRLYSDPTCARLIASIAKQKGLEPEQVMVGNGSDENLFFALRAFCDEENPLCLADITYGCYAVWCDLLHIPMDVVPLSKDFTIDPTTYYNTGHTIVIANPNAPTGLALPLEDIAKIAANNPESVVIIDEAYVDFGTQSAVSLINSYENLLVVQTFSKSRSFAGGRLGFAMGNADLIADLNAVKFSINPYNVNSLTLRIGEAIMEDTAYFQKTCDKIIATREATIIRLTSLGFKILHSKTNFVFAKHHKVCGKDFYEKLKEKGVLIRHFNAKRIADYIRITIGTNEQMQVLFEKVEEILREAAE